MVTICLFVFLVVWLAVASRWYEVEEGNGFTTLCVILYANFQLLIAYHKVSARPGCLAVHCAHLYPLHSYSSLHDIFSTPFPNPILPLSL